MSISATVGKVARAARQGLTLIRSGQVSQAAALCYRTDGGERTFLLITGRKSGKLGLPKGNVDPGETSPIAAAREAFEEAGVRGTAQENVVASYSYRKVGKRLRRHVTIHPLKITGLSGNFPEKGERTLTWLSAEEAARQVSEPALTALFQSMAKGLPSDLAQEPESCN